MFLNKISQIGEEKLASPPLAEVARGLTSTRSPPNSLDPEQERTNDFGSNVLKQCFELKISKLLKLDKQEAQQNENENFHVAAYVSSSTWEGT